MLLLGVSFQRVSVSSPMFFPGGLCSCSSLFSGSLSRGFFVQSSLSRGLSPGVSVQGVSGWGSLSRVVCVQEGLCPGGSLSRGLSPGGSGGLFRGSLALVLCPGWCVSRRVSVQGVSVKGSLSWRLPRQIHPCHMVKIWRYAFYLNVFFLDKS